MTPTYNIFQEMKSLILQGPYEIHVDQKIIYKETGYPFELGYKIQY